MLKLARPSLLLIAGALVSLLAFSGCESTNTSENAAVISSMKTFQMGDVRGSLMGFSSRDQKDVMVLTQEMVARQLESLGYREVQTQEEADMTVIPGWSFYQNRNPAVQNSEPVSYEQTLYQSGNMTMARLGVEVLGGSGQVLWSSMASWGIQASTNTTQDFAHEAELALVGFPEANPDAAKAADASMKIQATAMPTGDSSM